MLIAPIHSGVCLPIANVDECRAKVDCDIISRQQNGLTVEATVTLEGFPISQTSVPVPSSSTHVSLLLSMGDPASAISDDLLEVLERHGVPRDRTEASTEVVRGCILWDTNLPMLYDVKLTLRDKEGKKVDEVYTYVGMRKLEWEDGQMRLNSRPLFQRLVLDQVSRQFCAITHPAESLK